MQQLPDQQSRPMASNTVWSVTQSKNKDKIILQIKKMVEKSIISLLNALN